MKKNILFIICMIVAISAHAKGDTTAHTLPATIGSRFYFPNSIGLSVPFRNIRTNLRNGLSLNTAVEYRLRDANAFYFRLDYNVLNNNYTSSSPTLPTNIIQGKLSSDFILGGAGYRKKLNRWAIYVSEQPGLGMHTFDRAAVNTSGIIISRVTNDSFAAKSALGFEYYIKSHFNVFFEPSYYKYFSHAGFSASHSQFMSFNIGISTARF